jgi:chemotaxis protein MotB
LKKAAQGEQDNEERWLLTYVDLITLMMAFFVVMFAMAKVDSAKYAAVSDSLRMALGSPNNSIIDLNGRGYPGGPGGDSRAPGDGKGSLASLRKSFTKLIHDKNLEGSVVIRSKEHSITLALADNLLFDVGSAQLTNRSRQLLDAIASILYETDNPIRIEGHTDNTPIHNAKYISNWQLSTDRATNVIMYLIEKYGFSPERLSASGYGEYKPLFPNDTPEHRAKNRRVDFVISDNKVIQ